MKIKKFRGETPNDAMVAIRREMGDDAIILSTKRVRDPEALSRGERVEMTAAIDWEPGAPTARMGPKPGETTGDLGGVQAQLEELRRAVQRLGSPLPAPDELVLEDVYRTVYAEMVSNDVDPTLALRVVRAVKGRVAAGAEGRARVAGAVQETILSLLPPLRPSRRPVEVLVGPTGVGKTTTAAKLAARRILDKSRPVTLVTCDTYRVAAVDQLRAYAGAMGARFEVVRSPVELDAVMTRHKRAGHVIVDTEGRGQRDLRSLEPMFRFLAERNDVERHLVLSANTKPKDLDETIHRFRHAAPERLIFTKVDETNSYGSILSESVRSGIPVSYLGTGQKVPEELLAATPRKLAELAVSALG